MLPKNNIIFLIQCIFVLVMFVISGCDNGKTPEGVVATVNDEPIELHALQTLLDCRSSTQGILPKPSMEEMRANYVNALKTLITHILVRQELRSKDIKIDYDHLLEELKADYGNDELGNYLKNSFIREDDWKQLIKDYIEIDIFKKRILLPGIKIDTGEIKDYYEKNKESFKLPDMVKICYVEAETEKEIDNICASFEKQDENIIKYTYCFDIISNEIPQDWQKESKTLKLNTCAKKKRDENGWRTIVIMERNKNHSASLGEVYGLVENILIEQKKQEAFDRWLENKIKKSRIYVSPELNNALSNVLEYE